jgi:hypothetical protein
MLRIHWNMFLRFRVGFTISFYFLPCFVAGTTYRAMSSNVLLLTYSLISCVVLAASPTMLTKGLVTEGLFLEFLLGHLTQYLRVMTKFVIQFTCTAYGPPTVRFYTCIATVVDSYRPRVTLKLEGNFMAPKKITNFGRRPITRFSVKRFRLVKHSADDKWEEMYSATSAILIFVLDVLFTVLKAAPYSQYFGRKSVSTFSSHPCVLYTYTDLLRRLDQ